MYKLLYQSANILLYLLTMKPAVFQNWCGCLGKEKNLLILPGIKPQFLDILTRNVITTTTKLLRRQNKLSVI
jgi:hypothetical protein